tara:strand:- start:9392 stop:10333 length:942 start_codon:yes stop_codon:yes gene_type:complete
MSDFTDVQKSLRQFAGIDLAKNRRIPSNWVILKEQIVTGDDTTYIVKQGVFPEAFSGYAKGIGEQTSSGYMGLGNRNLGMEIEVEDLNTGEYGADRVWENISYDRQEEFFNNTVAIISKTITSVSSISAPQERQGSLSQVGVQRNPSEWMVGDIVNVSRSELDGGGLTTGYVVKVYPISVEVLWSPDKLHPNGWTTEEKKTGLIYVGHEKNVKSIAKKWRNKQYSAETESRNAPEWTKHIKATPQQIEDYTTSSSPLPISSNVWAESDAYKDRLDNLLIPFRMHTKYPVSIEEIIDNQTINGFEPFTGFYRHY